MQDKAFVETLPSKLSDCSRSILLDATPIGLPNSIAGGVLKTLPDCAEFLAGEPLEELGKKKEEERFNPEENDEIQMGIREKKGLNLAQPNKRLWIRLRSGERQNLMRELVKTTALGQQSTPKRPLPLAKD